MKGVGFALTHLKAMKVCTAHLVGLLVMRPAGEPPV